jgi:hypothetical protein
MRGAGLPLNFSLARADSQVDYIASCGSGCCPFSACRDTSQYASGDWSVRSKRLEFAVPVRNDARRQHLLVQHWFWPMRMHHVTCRVRVRLTAFF